VAHDLARIFGRVESLLTQRPRMALSDLSRELGVERHTVERAVRDAKGKSFREFHREFVLSHITETLLAGSDLSLKEFAADLGYSSVQAFTRFVSKASGTTPARLRRQALLPPQLQSATNGKKSTSFAK
jgi:AraC-like DNA-binding protein